MGLYNFQKRFAPFILSGEKTHTIRSVRANPDKPGNTLHLYTGLRQKGAQLLMRVPCVKVEEIEICAVDHPTHSGVTKVFTIEIDGHYLDRSEKEALARRDGFDSLAAMMRFWQEPKNRLPFRGHIIHWRK
jgi:uncharacterized protein YqfB (UPF0267 family)